MPALLLVRSNITGNAKTERRPAVIRWKVVSYRRPKSQRATAPRTTPRNATGAALRIGWFPGLPGIERPPLVGWMPAILDPFPRIAEHVVKTVAVREIAPHLR